jgi:hypothetical protein
MFYIKSGRRDVASETSFARTTRPGIRVPSLEIFMFSRSLSDLLSIRSGIQCARTSRRSRRRFEPDALDLEPRIALSGETHSVYEIIYLGDVGKSGTGPILVYLDGGSNPIDAQEWENYVPPPGYIKNTERNVQFNSSEFMSSPDSTGNEYITTSDGYTWFYMAKTVSANWPFHSDDYKANFSSGYQAAAFGGVTPPPGTIKWTVNTKNQEMTFDARNAEGKPIERYFITDPWGDRFMMYATSTEDPAEIRSNFLSAVLPKGWTMSIGFLKHNLTTLPAYNADGTSNYNIFRDSADDSFQQISWGKRGWGTSQMIAGMPIWGSSHPSTIRTNPTHDNVVYAASGHDTIHVSGLINTIYGDAGTDTAVFHGRRSQYTITRITADGSEVVVTPRGPESATHVTTLYDIEHIRFARGC